MLKEFQLYINDIDAMSKSSLNQDQKDLIKRILKNTYEHNKEDFDNVFQLLKSRVSLGFVFDAAPSVDNTQVALLSKDNELSFENTKSIGGGQLIIGENYDALKNLLVLANNFGDNYKYDVIYIDPPYNTEATGKDGNNFASEKDDVKASKFIYRDKFSRTGWLNMMNERLRMARQLLKEDGVIFVSIDDKEQAYLKVLMDEIFGEQNFVNNFMWMHGLGKKDKLSRTLQEYILCYSKNKNCIASWTFDKITEYDTLQNSDNDPRGQWFSGSISFDEKRSNKKHSNYFTICSPSGIKWTRQWLCTENEMKDLLDNNLIYFGTAPEFNNVPRYKKFNGETSQIIPTNFFNNHGTTRSAKTELYKIITKPNNQKSEHTPKPVLLLKDIIKLINNKATRVLDFFAGSGTTAHAVLDLNREDGGHRTYTLVTNNENNIAKDVCYERLFRINKGVGSKGEKDFDWIKKNEPYNTSLDVFNIKYFDTNLLNTQNELIKATLKQEFVDFGIDIRQMEKMNTFALLTALYSLKPVKKDEDE